MMILRTFFSFVMLSLLLAVTPLDGKTSGQSPQQNSPAIAKLVLAQHVETLGPPAREPMIIEHPSGVQFVTGYMTPGRPQLWKSLDQGATWTRVDVGSEAQGAIGNSDCDLAVAADGTIYLVSLIYNGKEQGIGIAVGVSHDIGATWSWARISKVRFDDRPWVAIAPDGTAHIIWNNGSGVSHSVSRDRGVTWTTVPRIYHKGGSSHLAVGPNGEVAARIIPLSWLALRTTVGLTLSLSVPMAARLGRNTRPRDSVIGTWRSTNLEGSRVGLSRSPGTSRVLSTLSGPIVPECGWPAPPIAVLPGASGVSQKQLTWPISLT
jgi:hypothetical protein